VYLKIVRLVLTADQRWMVKDELEIEGILSEFSDFPEELYIRS